MSIYKEAQNSFFSRMDRGNFDALIEGMEKEAGVGAWARRELGHYGARIGDWARHQGAKVSMRGAGRLAKREQGAMAGSEMRAARREGLHKKIQDKLDARSLKLQDKIDRAKSGEGGGMLGGLFSGGKQEAKSGGNWKKWAVPAAAVGAPLALGGAYMMGRPSKRQNG